MYEKPTQEELFRMIMVDVVRKVELSIELKDSDEDTYSVQDIIGNLTGYVQDQLTSDETNSIKQQIYPLMAQAVAGGLTKLLGTEYATVFLTNEEVRYSLIHMMTVGFCLLKFIQKNDISIHTTETEMTEEEINRFKRMSKAGDALIQYSALGGNPQEALQELVKRGKVTKEDLKEWGVEDLVEGVEEPKKEVN